MFFRSGVICFFYFIIVFAEYNDASVVNSKPICSIYTPDSLLSRCNRYRIVDVGSRRRYATCTGAAWFHEHYLAIVNLLDEHITVYKFNETRDQFVLLQSIKGVGLYEPEHISLSPDETLLAVANARVPGFSIFRIDPETHLIEEKPAFEFRMPIRLHNIRFSPDGNYLACATFDKAESLSICRIAYDNKNFAATSIYTKATPEGKFRLKGVNFTRNSRYVVLAYSLSLRATTRGPFEGLVLVYEFNTNGTLGRLASTLEGNFQAEDIVFINNDRNIVLPHQGGDELFIYKFNAETGKISEPCEVISNPEARLSFPHGMSVSSDGHHLAVANYGDDKCTIYRINKESNKNK